MTEEIFVQKNKVIAAEEVTKLVKSGDTIAISGVVGMLNPEKVYESLEVGFLTEGKPRDLTVFELEPGSVGPGFEHFSHEGMVRRWIITYADTTLQPERNKAVLEDKTEAYLFPYHTTYLLLRAMAEGQPGYLTKVGLHTWVDPRLGGGKFNSITKEDLVELVNLKGEELLFYKSFPINVSIFRASTADEDGNLTFDDEVFIGGALYQALAAKAYGGKVIAQVKRVVKSGTLNPKSVRIPGVFVDAIIVDENQCQSERAPHQYVPGLDGQWNVPPPPCPRYPLDHEKVVGRRIALELKMGQAVNLGAGLSRVQLMPITLEEDVQDLVHFTVEHGVLGGMNYGSAVHINPTSFLDYLSLWTWYRGGSLDLAILGFGQVDKDGNINLNRFGNELRGPGGALDIAASAKKVVFGGVFTQGGLKTEVGDGRIQIAEEGRNRKFLNKVENITVNGKYLYESGKEVLIITERAVFKINSSGLELVECAPGINIETDILSQMDFRPKISASLGQMPERLFKDEPLGLRKEMLGYEEPGRSSPVSFVPVDRLRRSLYWSTVVSVQES